MGSVKDGRSKDLVTVRVDNLEYSVTADLLKRLFQKYGEIEDTHVMIDERTNKSLGYGFVR